MSSPAEAPEQVRPARLVLLCGLPGAGKSTLARTLVAQLPAITFSPDDWSADLQVDVHDEPFRYRLEQRFCLLAWDLLALGVNVVLEFGLWGYDERELLRSGARTRGFPVELRYLQVPFDDLWQRVETRNDRAKRGEVSLTRAELERAAGIFQPPDVGELDRYDSPAPLHAAAQSPTSSSGPSDPTDTALGLTQASRHRSNRGNLTSSVVAWCGSRGLVRSWPCVGRSSSTCSG